MEKKISIIGTRGYPSYYGGFETAVRKLAPYLAERGWDVTVYGRPGATRDDDPGRDPRVKTVFTRGIESKSISTLTYGATACLHSARDKPDVALVMNVANGFFLPLLRWRGIPTLVNVDGIEWDRDKWGRFGKAVFHMGAKWTARHGTRMVYDSLEIARRWRNEFRLEGEFIPYGGDIPNELPVERGLTRRGYVLVVARFVPENTVEEFIQAARTLSSKWDVVIVGSSGYGGPLEEQVAALSEENTRVHWLGHVSDDQRLLALWQHAGVYFHGHSVGGTNPALVQAMAAGAPTVARDTPYNREVLGDAGVFALPTAESIIDAVSPLMADSVAQQSLSMRAVERAAIEYSWLSVCERYENALLDLMQTQTTTRNLEKHPEAAE